MEFSIRAVLSGTFATVKERFGGLLGLYGIYFGLTIAMFAVFAVVVGVGAAGALAAGGMGGGDPADPFSALGALGAGVILGAIVFYVAIILLSLAQSASMSAYATPLRRLTVGEALGVGWRSSLTLLGLLIVLAIGYVVCAVVLSLVVAGLAALGDAGAVLGGLIAIAAILFIGARLSVMFPVVAVEGERNPLTAIARSWRLTSGHVLKILAVLVLFMLIIGAMVMVALVPMGGAMATLGASSGAEPALGMVFGTFGLLLVVGVLMSIIAASFMSSLHAQLAGGDGADYQDTFG